MLLSCSPPPCQKAPGICDPKIPLFILLELIIVIRANRLFEGFVRIGLTRYKNRLSFANDSRESRCESPDARATKFKINYQNAKERKVRNEKSAQRGSLGLGYPCGHPTKNFGQAPQILESKQRFGTVIPRGRPRKDFGLKNFGLIFRSL